MPQVDEFGIRVEVPGGWHVAIRRRLLDGAVAHGRAPVAAAAGERPRPVLHASTRAIPPGCGDFGGGAVELLSTEDIFIALMRNGREGGALRYPAARESGGLQGEWQTFEGGEIYAMTGRTAYAVRGAVLAAWKAAGGISGRYGWPVSDTTATADGRLKCQFQNGTITA